MFDNVKIVYHFPWSGHAISSLPGIAWPLQGSSCYKVFHYKDWEVIRAKILVLRISQKIFHVAKSSIIPLCSQC